VAALAVVVAVVLFQSGGGRMFIVETPSMGTAAPVGTLVLTEPTTVAALEVGDVISFRPPQARDEVYTHRITAIDANGAISTRGDINGADDPWFVTQPDLVGKATTLLPAVGWLIRAIPYLAIGFTLVWLITRLVRSPTLRAADRIVGFSLVATITTVILKPFAGVVLLAAVADGSGARATVVSTGILPIRVDAVKGGFARLSSGEVGSIDAPTLASSAEYQLSTALDLPFLGWVVFWLICCIPLFVILLVGLPSESTASLQDRHIVSRWGLAG
jgi:signal peptidase I